MSLATRCIYCNATFKLVQDQLKVSQGWVKCGQCYRAFNALETIFDTKILPAWSNDIYKTNEPSALNKAPQALSTIQAPQIDTLERPIPPPSKRRGRRGTRGRTASGLPDAEFIKNAEKQAIWRHPVVRLLLGLLVLLLTAVLGLQMAHHWRNTLAANYPATRPWLQQWCNALPCKISAPMDISALRVDSIAVVKSDLQGADAYKLTVIVQNTSNIPLQWPTLDLILTNINGEVLIRRSLPVSAAQQIAITDDTNVQASHAIALTAEVLPGLTELQWQMRAPDLQLASYTAELYYP